MLKGVTRSSGQKKKKEEGGKGGEERKDNEVLANNLLGRPFTVSAYSRHIYLHYTYYGEGSIGYLGLACRGDQQQPS